MSFFLNKHCENNFKPSDLITGLFAINNSCDELGLFVNTLSINVFNLYNHISSNFVIELNNLEKSKQHILSLNAVLKCLQKFQFEFKQNGTMIPLNQYCEEKQNGFKKLDRFIKKTLNNKFYLSKLQFEINNIHIETLELDKIFQTCLTYLKHEFQELKALFKMQKNYCFKKYEVKLDKNIENNQKNIINNLSKKVDMHKLYIKQENRLAEESNNWFYADIAHHFNLIQFNEQTKHNPVQMRQKLESSKNNLEYIKKYYTNCIERFEKCNTIINENNTIKRHKQINDEYNRKLILSIIHIQCWWRTILVLFKSKFKPRKKKKLHANKKTN